MNTINRILDECEGMMVALFIEGGMFVDGKVIRSDETTVTLEVRIAGQRQAFSGGDDLKKLTIIHATVLKEKIMRVDRIATGGG